MLKLYTYYRSSAAYRIRIALNYKNLPFESIPINLYAGEHLSNTYNKVNAQSKVPTFEEDGFQLGQSSAILEYLEEKYPKPALLPTDLQDRAWVRYLAQIIISDMHPINNLPVLKYLADPLKLSQETIQIWYHHWLKKGFDALETVLANHPKCKFFCFGDSPTFADICLIPQLYNAKRFQFNLDNYPTLNRINEHCLTLPYFKNATPENQIDCPQELKS